MRKTPEWLLAKRLCEQTVLATYPNCLPVNDIAQTDQLKEAEAGDKAAAKIEEMGRRGYLYDYARKSWLPTLKMQAFGCLAVPAFPNNLRKLGDYTWKCPSDAQIPQGIPDSNFSKEGQ